MTSKRNQTAGPPLLSVCIPCHNGAAYLRVVLEALLPQARELVSHVEILVVDDCSTDDTSALVTNAARHGPVRYIRNDANLGMSNNIIAASAQHATGEYVWVLSQHNVLFPGALSRVIQALKSNGTLDAFYVNFFVARFPSEFPVSAVGGYEGSRHYLANRDTTNHALERWDSVLDAHSSAGTQTYAHIIRRVLVREFWAQRTIGREFTRAVDTYSQTFAVAHMMFGRPAYYIGEPVMTIYDGASTWSSFNLQARVYLSAYPDLLAHYSRLGWRGQRFRDARVWGGVRAGRVMAELLREWHPAEARLAARYVWKYWRVIALSALFKAVLEGTGVGSRATRPLKQIGRTARQYFLVNWRPARWIRRHIT